MKLRVGFKMKGWLWKLFERKDTSNNNWTFLSGPNFKGVPKSQYYQLSFITYVKLKLALLSWKLRVCSLEIIEKVIIIAAASKLAIIIQWFIFCIFAPNRPSRSTKICYCRRCWSWLSSSDMETSCLGWRK